MTLLTRLRRWMTTPAKAVASLALLATLAGCAGLPPLPPQAPEHTLVAPTDSTLGRAVAKATLPAGQSGLRGLPQADFALDARVALMRRAQVSIDLQTYQIGNDAVGRTVLRELRDAARRGVRVRLLVDDFYTLGLGPLLAGLAAESNAQVRLFNPFVYGRDSGSGRMWNLATDGRRLNHRMHNKLLVVDGVMAVVGGRNLADEYFMRSPVANFIDLDFVVAGAALPRLSELFDQYWNSPRVRDIRQLGMAAQVATPSPAQQRQVLDDAVDRLPPWQPPAGLDMLGQPALGVALDQGTLWLAVAHVTAVADPPDKTFDPAAPADLPAEGSVFAWGTTFARQARHEMLLVTPYFLPDRSTRHALADANSAGVKTLVMTNSVASSDEPLVSIASARYRAELLGAGLRLFEVNPRPQMPDERRSGPELAAQTRLHAKLAVIDRRVVLVGSMNLDPRSHRINTEIGIAIDSPALGEAVLVQFNRMIATDAVHEVEQRPGGLFRWRLRRPDGDAVSDDEPGLDLWSRWRLQLLSLFVPDELL